MSSYTTEDAEGAVQQIFEACTDLEQTIDDALKALEHMTQE